MVACSISLHFPIAYTNSSLALTFSGQHRRVNFRESSRSLGCTRILRVNQTRKFLLRVRFMSPVLGCQYSFQAASAVLKAHRFNAGYREQLSSVSSLISQYYQTKPITSVKARLDSMQTSQRKKALQFQTNHHHKAHFEDVKANERPKKD